jgi:hypothetical protein
VVQTEGSEAGDRIYLEGSCASDDFPKTLKTDVWKRVKDGLVVLGGKATFAGKCLKTDKGEITVSDIIPEGASIS